MNLSPEALDELATVLEADGAVYERADRKTIYWKTFWKPWTRSAFRSSIIVEASGVAFIVWGSKDTPNGSISIRYFATREDGEWDLSRRETLMEK